MLFFKQEATNWSYSYSNNDNSQSIFVCDKILNYQRRGMWSLRVLVTNLDSGDSKYDNMMPPSGHFAKFLDILFPDAVYCVPRIRKRRTWEDLGQHPYSFSVPHNQLRL